MPAHDHDEAGAEARRTLIDGLGRRGFFRAAATVGAAGAGAQLLGAAPAAASARPAGSPPGVGLDVLQPGAGPIRGRYLESTPETVSWGLMPNRRSRPALRVDSGTVVTIDTVSHEGVLADQGRDPDGYFGDHGVPRERVLADARAIAASGIEHDPASMGPHVITGPIDVRGARPGDVLKVEVLDLRTRVPYGVVSNRHGRGALPGELPEDIVGDPSTAPYLNEGGNISVFTPLVRRRGSVLAELPAGTAAVRFPLSPFLGIMGVGTDTFEAVNSIPPTVAGGNLDINELGVGSVLYLPVQLPGAQFVAADPHFAQGDGEVALTALEGSLRATLRLTRIRPGGDAPAIAFDRPFAETDEHWIPIGLSDWHAGSSLSLDTAMKEAVRNALRFLTEEHGMAPAVAYAYLSAATDFEVSQVVDRTTGIHALIRKADFAD
ncbi:acetamidase/formamidase family protein [Allonocardiopsis opalescens]|uniref:Acetamidase/formamidase n=1 Tax=Allonocardiopsis opalescens TaxID=1144618 RepID=A0A2T0PWU4_9ACTN|nr:acetamidase/formamidase family protein [Allonocardiopsis opalescens]PRX96010.1 acetamidase/formamidase [Allonocardiopsis opalescens]